MARVDGDFNVDVKLVSKSQLFGVPATQNFGWHFSPKCSDGPCTVVWNDIEHESFRGTLTRKGPGYSGSATGDFGDQCGKVSTKSTITFSLKVTKAKAIGGEWRATQLRGTLAEYDPAQLGCTVGRASYSITATLLT